MLSISFTSSVRTQVEIAREANPAFHAEMAAHSAMEFALKQLSMNPAWDGTEGDIPLTSTSSFRVSRQAGLDPGDPAVLTLEGHHGVAQVNLEMTVSVNQQSDILREQALSILGGHVDFKGLQVQGSMLITDTLDVVEDYEPDPADWDNGEWVAGGAESLGVFSFEDVSVNNGQLRKYSETDYDITGEEVQVSEGIHAPSYSMAPYLEPGPNIIQVYNLNSAVGVTVDETVVAFLDPGEVLRIVDSNLKGGLVVYVDPDYDLRQGPLNGIIMKKTSSIGGGSQGVHPHLGLLAPACELSSPGCDHAPFLNGISYVNRLHEFHLATIMGQLIVQNDADQLWYSNVYYSEAMAEDPPPGLGYFSQAGGSVAILNIREVYDSEGIPEGGPTL